MTYSTRYHEWYLPSDGEDVMSDGLNQPLDVIDSENNWGDLLQTILHEIDLRTAMFDTKANRPDPPDIPDGTYCWFFATDETPMGIYVYNNATGWQTVWDGDAYTLDGIDSSGFVQADGSVPVTGGLDYGQAGSEVVSETTSPMSFDFSGSETRDTHLKTDVTISNSSGASATEDITVELYDGTDTTGTLLVSETTSVTVADAASTTVTFITTDKKLDGGTYHIEVTQSGTALSIDQTDEYTEGSVFSISETASGDLILEDENGTRLLTVDQLTGGSTLPFDQLTETAAAGIPASAGVLSSTATHDTAMAVQVGDDSAASGDPGYAAALRYYSESGEQLASLSADTVDNHWGVYTKADAVGSGDTQNNKRLSVGGGSELVNALWQKVEQMKLDAMGVTGGQSRAVFQSTSGNQAYILFKQGSSDHFSLVTTSSDMYIYNYTAGASPVAWPANRAATLFDERVWVEGETEVHFGNFNDSDNNGDFRIYYDSVDDTLKFVALGSGPIAELDKSGNLTIEGSLTENGTVGW